MTCDKTVAERLREEVARPLKYRSCTIPVMVGIKCSLAGGCGRCHERAINTLADMIEAEQAKPQLPEGIEWPRYESGELVEFGDEYVNADSETSNAHWIRFGPSTFTLTSYYGDESVFDYGTPVKRPEPEVLDADGVPINVGDTVWYEGREWRVSGVYVCSDGDSGVNLESFVKDEFDDPVERVSYAWNKYVTHRKPDTQEDIDADMDLPAWDYLRKYGMVPVRAEGETKKEHRKRVRVMHRQHLLARQRKLLGGE